VSTERRLPNRAEKKAKLILLRGDALDERERASASAATEVPRLQRGNRAASCICKAPAPRKRSSQEPAERRRHRARAVRDIRQHGRRERQQGAMPVEFQGQRSPAIQRRLRNREGHKKERRRCGSYRFGERLPEDCAPNATSPMGRKLSAIGSSPTRSALPGEATGRNWALAAGISPSLTRPRRARRTAPQVPSPLTIAGDDDGDEELERSARSANGRSVLTSVSGTRRSRLSQSEHQDRGRQGPTLPRARRHEELSLPPKRGTRHRYADDQQETASGSEQCERMTVGSP
jgi:hypothetical protein